MKSIPVTQARKDIYRLLESVETEHQPIQITGKQNNAVLVSESDWLAIQETLHLLSIPGMRESIREGLDTSFDDCDEEPDW